MKNLFLASAIFCLVTLTALSASAQMNNDKPNGYWLTKSQRGVIHIKPCDENTEALCGSLYWIIDGGLQYDVHNPNEELRSRPLCGLELVTDFKPHNEKFWTDGKIYKADDGDTYNASMQIIPPNRLEVRGYIGVPLFGKSQIWTRVDPLEYEKCTPAPPKEMEASEE